MDKTLFIMCYVRHFFSPLAFFHSITKNMIIPPQAVYLYFGNWTPEIDELVLDMIIKLKGETQWMLDEFPSWFLMTAQREVLSKTNILFTEPELKQRLDFMKLRYTTFKALSRTHGAYYDVQAEFVRANDEVWERIFKVRWCFVLLCICCSGDDLL